MNLEKKSTLLLVNRLNKNMMESERLDIEYNEIIKELHRRIPTLKNDVNIQPRNSTRKVKCIKRKRVK